MAACPSCGHENADDARFCSACGTALATSEPAREQRKVVTVLFCDLVGSTALGESTDPEALRARMRRYFEDLRVVLERHGGSVEKFVGDAVMAVFGIPMSHEDDALRAVRAASEMRAAIAEHGLEARIGVNTGEVVVGGEGETLVTGDAVNVAARLEQAAPNGEILIGSETRVLVRDAVVVEAVEPLTLRGKSKPVDAYRLLEVSGEAPLARHLDTPLVGRERERQRLWRAYEDAVADSSCQLFTLLGPAGIGKSRLVADFLDSVGDSADVLRGRCLSYGEGITYWPLVEILIGVDVAPDSVIGTSPAETQLAFRRLLEARAASRPQVVVIDDLQWAEPVFVDLLEHVADLSRDAPIFLLCIARTELLDSRPGWGGGKLNATSLLLEPLDPDECSELIDRLVSDAALTGDLRQRITTASAGNPLYVEEMLAMLREHGGDGEIAVPPTIHALLQARIDSLDGDVRVVMERGSVEGEVFHRGSVAVLAPDPVRPAVESHLATLVRKELIRSTSPTFPEDEGFRFRHLLIRDAAYESLPKATRAELHERFADWLATHDLVEIDEIVGYHLEQAHRYRSELDHGDMRLAELGNRAAGNLALAGQAAMDRGDWGTARGLLRRARDLLPEGSDERAALGPDLALVLQEVGESAEAVMAADEAAGARDPVLRARGLIAQADASGFVADANEELRAGAEEARATLEASGDQLGLAQYWRWHGYDFWARLQAAAAQKSWEKGLVHAAAAGVKRLQVELEINILSALYLGPTPIAEALPYAQAVLERSTAGSLAEASALRVVGYLRSCQGFAEEGRELLERGRETFRQAGLHVSAGGYAMAHSEIEWRAGDIEAQERVLREGVETLDRLGDQFFFSTVALRLADCLLLTRAPDDAEVADICRVARERTLEADLVNFVYLDSIECRRLAHAGSTQAGVELARGAAETADETDNFDARSHAWYAFAETLLLAGELGEAGRAAAQSIEIRTAKGDVAGAAALERRYQELGIAID